MQKRIVFAGTIAAVLAVIALPLASHSAPQAAGAAPVTPSSAAQAPVGPPPAGPPPGGGPGGPHRPLPKPVNLKVLPKDTPPEEVMKIMHNFEGSLGVECSFCHVRDEKTKHMDFASDAKDDKQMARTMMLMTRTINEQFMSKIDDPDAKPADKHVTCGTCHRGHSMPEHFVPPPHAEHHDHAEGMAPMQKPQ